MKKAGIFIIAAGSFVAGFAIARLFSPSSTGMAIKELIP